MARTGQQLRRRTAGFTSAALAEGGAEFGVVVNPFKSDLLVVEPGDRVVVLAEV